MVKWGVRIGWRNRSDMYVAALRRKIKEVVGSDKAVKESKQDWVNILTSIEKSGGRNRVKHCTKELRCEGRN